ncbi:MAG: VRR-NUC domain-containing protein [Cyanobacteria bacterium]|nr:VRR-NUC domain-containing protein [Cyanobacteriota bacterium]
MSEQELQQRIRLELGSGPVRLWRNNVGALRDQRGRLVSYGLCPGSSDLIGLRRLRVGPEHLGQEMAVFCALEIKSQRGRPSAEQQRFLAQVGAMGGLAGVIRSLEQARAVLQLDN